MLKDKKSFLGFVLIIVLGMQLGPIIPVIAEQNDTSSTSESSIPNRTQDPLTQLGESESTQSSTSSIDSSDESTETSSSNEDSTSDTETTNSTEQSNSSTSDSIRPQADTYLREGTFGVDDPADYDIDKDFSSWLRNGYGGYGTTVSIQTIDSSTWSGDGKAVGELTVEDMEELKEIVVNGSFSYYLSSVKGIQFAANLESLQCENNRITSMNVTTLQNLKSLNCANNTDLNNISGVTGLTKLEELIVKQTKIISLNVESLTKLKVLDFSLNSSFTNLGGANYLDELEKLDGSATSIRQLDISNLDKLEKVNVNTCYNLEQLNIKNCGLLKELNCDQCQLAELDLEGCESLIKLILSHNKLTKIKIDHLDNLEEFDCDYNYLKRLDFSQDAPLKYIRAIENQIYDITSLYGKQNLNTFYIHQQKIYMPIPEIDSQGTVIINKLKTTLGQGLSVTNSTVSPTPTIEVLGDKFKLSTVSSESLNGKSVNFNYSSNLLGEGGSGYGFKYFTGTIHFYQELNSQIKPSSKKVKTGETVSWVWDTKNPTTTTAENLKISLNLPSNLQIDENTIEINGSPATLSDIDGSREYNLAPDDQLSITFDTVASGNADDWLTPIGELDWEYSNVESPLSKQVKNSVQIKDDEQKYIPTNEDLLEISSVPVAFNFGTKSIDRVDRSYHLNAEQYQTNTNVVSDGFYVRVQDDRATSTGWSLAAKLSDFTYGSNNDLMPNSATTSIKLEDLSVESIINPDTPEETINPSPTNPPTSVQQAEFIAGDDSAQTLISAAANQGVDTWQLRIPFDKVSLNVPANGGRPGEQCSGKLTWLLTDTP